jgi:hypothetical protein
MAVIGAKVFGKLRGNHRDSDPRPAPWVRNTQRQAVISTSATHAYVDVPAPFIELADIFA